MNKEAARLVLAIGESLESETEAAVRKAFWDLSQKASELFRTDRMARQGHDPETALEQRAVLTYRALVLYRLRHLGAHSNYKREVPLAMFVLLLLLLLLLLLGVWVCVCCNIFIILFFVCFFVCMLLCTFTVVFFVLVAFLLVFFVCSFAFCSTVVVVGV